MIHHFKRRLLEHLRHDSYTPSRLDELVRQLGIDEDERPRFEQEIRDLADSAIIEIGPTGLIQLPSLASRGDEITGRFSRNPRGFGFVSPDPPVREGSVYIPPDHTADALTGDTVRASIRRDRARERSTPGPQWTGSIVEVVKRKRSSFAGELARRGGQWLVFPDGRELTTPIVVRDAEAKNAREGDKVVVEITAYPEGDMLAEGVILRVLGDAGRPDVETQATIAAFDLPGEHPEECHEQARHAAARFEEEIDAYRARGASVFREFDSTGRLDLSETFILTIDPPDAKDYDDAISIERTEWNGRPAWKLGVHIADVSYFIPPGSPLDLEARDRCNSVYLPRHVIPMLPEVLSNGICSLQEGVFRYCKSAFMVYDEQGEIRAEGVGQTLIRSAKRLTYLEAQALIDGRPDEARAHARTEPRYTDQLIHALREMDRCARAIQARRKRQGMISLELPECVLIFDDEGRVVDAEREDDAFTHTLIEMFMVEANEVLARLFENMDVPLLRRVHPEPTPGDTETLRRAAMVAGFRIPARPDREEMQRLLDATRGTPAARAVHMALLRTLAKAEYSPAPIGHFALASEAYAHFTSPIRRYADLTVHRALSEYLRLTDNGQRRPATDNERRALGRKLRQSPLCPDEETLADIGRLCTLRENNAEEAERHLREFLVLQLLETKIGEELAGVVTGVTHRGVFVQIDKYLIDGFVKADDLPGDVTRSNAPPQWRLDPRTGALVDARSGRSFNMGDLVRVAVAAVDLPKRQLELVIADPASRAVGKIKTLTDKFGAPTGGLGHAQPAPGGAGRRAGWHEFEGRTGAQKRAARSRARDRRKKNHRRDS